MWLEIRRKLVHKFVGVLFALAPFFISPREVVLAAVIFSVFAILMYWVPKVAHLAQMSDRHTFGAVWHTLGIALTAYVFLPEEVMAYVFGIMVLTFSDSAAALIGKRFGRAQFRVLGYVKSIEGSLAFFVVTAFLFYVFQPEASVFQIITLSVLLTNVELFSVWGVDNFTLPPLAAALFMLV